MKINIVKPYHPDLSEIQTEFAQCLNSGMVTNNSIHLRTFEDKLKAYLNSPQQPVAYCNGEMALFALIQAWKHKLGFDSHQSFEVLVPSFTFSGTLNAIVTNNLKPVFCDINETLTLDVDKIKEVPDSVKMIVVVGVYGNLPDLDKVKDFAKKHNLILIFDNAPAFGSKFKGKYTSEQGFDEIYSFHATKIFSSMEGGAAISHDPQITECLQRLRDFGQYEKTRGDVDIPGLNCKMQEVSALVGTKNLEKIETILGLRQKNIEAYHKTFLALEQKGVLNTMKVLDNVVCNYLYYPIILNEEATDFVTYMNDNNIAVRRYYTSVHTLKMYKDKYRDAGLEFTNSIKDRVVSLPIHTIMEQEELEYMFTTVNKYFA